MAPKTLLMTKILIPIASKNLRGTRLCSNIRHAGILRESLYFRGFYRDRNLIQKPTPMQNFQWKSKSRVRILCPLMAVKFCVVYEYSFTLLHIRNMTATKR